MPPSEPDEPLPFAVGTWTPPRPKLKGYRKGEQHHLARLTDGKVRLMLLLRRRGWKLLDLTTLLNVSVTTVHHVCVGDTWRHVKDWRQLVGWAGKVRHRRPERARTRKRQKIV